jgi:hypothetical protein
MREGCIGKQNSRIRKWKIENGNWEEISGDLQTDSSDQEAWAR